MSNFSSPPAQPIDTANLALRQLDQTWLDEVHQMVNEPASQALTATTQKFDRKVLTEWLTTRPAQTNRCDWAILHQEFGELAGEFLGEIVLNEFDQKANAMNLRISLANPSLYGRGFGTEAIDAVLTFAFDKLQLSKVTLSVLVDNSRAIRVYQKLGFQSGREYSDGQRAGVKFRFLRMSVNKLQYIEAMCRREMALHLQTDPAVPGFWRFEFDSAKRRAGLCNYTARTISLSKHLVLLHDVDQARQVLWHEIAHALSGKNEGHGKNWLAKAKALGYRADKFSGTTIAKNTARWSGVCPAGHEHFRFRKPTRDLSCGVCGRGFSKSNLIRWTERL
jgi:RimJ/RimL family protein N-acetyltransferase/predicted SprT family Zn-dependent metalloprotease